MTANSVPARGACGGLQGIRQILSSAAPFSNEAGGIDQRRCLLAERLERVLGFDDKPVEPRLGPLDPEQRHQGGLAAVRVLGRRLAHGFGVALGVEQVVGELEGLAEGVGVGLERRAAFSVGAALKTCLLYTS